MVVKEAPDKLTASFFLLLSLQISHNYHVFIYIFYLLLLVRFLHLLAVWICFEVGYPVFITFSVVLCLHILLSSDYISIFYPLLSLCVSLPSSIDSSSHLLHSPSFSFSFPLSLFDPLKWDPTMFFPSCSPPTLWWGSEPPAGGIKDMIYRAPWQQKKRKWKKKNIKWEISFPAQ